TRAVLRAGNSERSRSTLRRGSVAPTAGPTVREAPPSFRSDDSPSRGGPAAQGPDTPRDRGGGEGRRRSRSRREGERATPPVRREGPPAAALPPRSAGPPDSASPDRSRRGRCTP